MSANKPRLDYIQLSELQQAKKNLKAEGYEIRGWARARGFKYDTVLKLLTVGAGVRIRGGKVTSRIIAQLKEEGLWPSDQRNRRAA